MAQAVQGKPISKISSILHCIVNLGRLVSTT